MPMPWPKPAPLITWRVAPFATVTKAMASRLARAEVRRRRRTRVLTLSRPEGSGPSADAEQAPLARDAAQFARAAVGEVDPRPGHEVLDGARDEHLAGVRCAHHARGAV